MNKRNFNNNFSMFGLCNIIDFGYEDSKKVDKVTTDTFSELKSSKEKKTRQNDDS